MIWFLIILLIICLFLCWLLIAPLIIEIDSNSASACLRWAGIGKVIVWYENEWLLGIRIFFYKKKLRIASIKRGPKKTGQLKAKKNKVKRSIPFRKFIKLMRTFQVEDWKLAIDTGDYLLNAQIYPFIFLPFCNKHLNVNFIEQNYLYLRVRNRPWKMLYSFIF